MPQIKKITDLTAPELDLFSRYSESQLFHINEPKPGIFIAESPNVIERALNAGYEPLAVLIEEKQADGLIPKLFFAYPELPVYTAKFDLLTNLTGFALTRGLLCAMKRKILPSVAEICEGKHRIAVLENVMNPTNIRGDLPLRRGPWNGRGAPDLRLQRSPLPESRQSQHGNCLPDSVDLFSEKRGSLLRRT